MTALSTNQNYLVSIRKGTGQDLNSSVQANAQAKLSLQINNQWVNVLQALGFSADSGSGVASAVGSAANMLQIFTGNTFLPEVATSQVWRGSNGLEFQLLLRFDAYDDEVADVVDPVKRLIAMWMPTRSQDTADNNFSSQSSVATTIANGINAATSAYNNTFLAPPGPTPYEFLTGRADAKLLTLTLGKFMTITSLIPGALHWEFENRFTSRGFPISAQVTIGLQSYTIPDANKVLGFFNSPSDTSLFGGI